MEEHETEQNGLTSAGFCQLVFFGICAKGGADGCIVQDSVTCECIAEYFGV